MRAYLNDGDGRFAEATDQLLPGVAGHGFDLEVADFDGDGRPDVYISNRWGVDELLLGRWAASTAVELAPMPAATALLGSYPNPFSGSTTIEFRLRAATRTRLVVYDALGRPVRELVDGVRPAGTNRVRWDGRDQAGRGAASGVYVYRLQAGDRRQGGRLLLLK